MKSWSLSWAVLASNSDPARPNDSPISLNCWSDEEVAMTGENRYVRRQGYVLDYTRS